MSRDLPPARASTPGGPPTNRRAHGYILDTETILAGIMVSRMETLPDRLAAAGRVTQRQANAATKYRDDYEVATGGGRGGESGPILAPWQRTPASEAQVNAISRVRRADAALGRGLVPLAVSVCVRGLTLTQLARAFLRRGGGIQGRTILRWVDVVLTTLADHYYGIEVPVEASGRVRAVVFSVNNRPSRKPLDDATGKMPSIR